MTTPTIDDTIDRAELIKGLEAALVHDPAFRVRVWVKNELAVDGHTAVLMVIDYIKGFPAK